MPSLDHLSGGTDADTDLYILSVIAFPNDAHRQQEWFDKARNSRTALFLAHQRPEMLADDPVLHERVIAAASGPRLRLGSEKRIGINTAGYRVAAFLLVRVLAGTGRGGSLSEAVDAFITGDGGRVKVPGASQATIWRWWEEYQSVSHLAAAFVYHRQRLMADPASFGLRTSFSPIGAGWGLAWAERARTVGEQYQPPHAQRALLDRERTWKAPRSLRLPEVSLDLPPPDQVTFTP